MAVASSGGRFRGKDYALLKSDLKLGQCWSVPYDDGSVNAVVFDPPYMEGLYRQKSEALAGSGTHSEFQKAYSNSSLQKSGGRKYHDAVLEAYLSVLPEVKRILVKGGTFNQMPGRGLGEPPETHARRADLGA